MNYMHSVRFHIRIRVNVYLMFSGSHKVTGLVLDGLIPVKYLG